MSASFSISASTGPYEVTVGPGLFSSVIAKPRDAIVISDNFFTPKFVATGIDPILLEATEREKSLDRAPMVIERMRAKGANRRSWLIAVGGGTIQDMSAFVASVYMRGLRWSYIPTTVLAMVDSCIGGKSSINVGAFKNLVGTFHPPQHIHIDPNLALTLPPEQFASGLIEAAKICFCRSAESFENHLATEPDPAMKVEALERLVVNSLLAKKYFIEIDEFDKKERLILNFGHTFGHAIEGASGYRIPHGIAVGLGILCSLEFQRQRGIDFHLLPGVLKLEAHLKTMIEFLPDLTTHLARIDIAEVLRLFESDKKHTSEEFTLLLVSATGEVVLENIERTDKPVRDVRRAIEATIKS